MRKAECFVLLVLGAMAALPATAAEVVYFANGSQMPIASHWVEDGMTYVDLGGNGVMAFPTSLIERIDSDAKIQLTASSNAATRGRMAPSRPGADVRPERPQRAPLEIDTEVETDGMGMAVTTPLKGQGPAAERLKQYALPGQGVPAGTRQQGGFQGAEREGNHHVIDSGQRIPQRRVGVQQRSGG